jgi:hypothetical protein
MPIALLLLLALFPIASSADALDPDAKSRMESELDAFRAAYSVGYVGRMYLELVDTAGNLQSGFGNIRPETSGRRSGDSLAYEIDLNGNIYRPAQTRSVVANGFPGTPVARGWEFKSEPGWIETYAELPFGPPVRAVFLGKSRDLKDKKALKALRAYLKGVPEAFARFRSDPGEAIRYFNAAPDAERVADTAYAEDLETKFDGGAMTGYSDRKARAVAGRLDRNGNDLPALGIEAEALCFDGRAAEAEPIIRRMEGIRPDYYRIPLARAACLERQDRHSEAEAQYLLARGTCARGRISGLLDRSVDAREARRFDSATVARGQRKLWVEWDALGFGIPQAILGTSLSLHAKLGACAASLTLGTGFANFAHPPAGFPALDIRLYSPGRWMRAYVGYGSINPFDQGPRIHYVFFGPEIGISQDIGDPYGFKLYYGITLLTDIKRDPESTVTARERTYLPQGAISYAF